ncbi:MAG TPA: autotransporter domain-containing protein, partial [Reyranella sp.]|nr:autotransporter domain-containing protein [Reyranella sp.]
MGSPKSKKSLPWLGGKTLVVLLSATALTPWDAFGQTTTWIGTVGSPTGDRWGVNANWSSNTPTPSGTAVFGGSAVTTIDFADNVNGIIFGTLQLNAGAPVYTFQTANSEPQLQGLGIVNNSANAPIFQLSQNAVLTFSNGASAANANFTLVNSRMNFFNSSSAANSTINGTRGQVNFRNNSSAANAAITNDGGYLHFFDTSTAGNATIVNNAGQLVFFGNSSAGKAVVTTNGYAMIFTDSSSGGNATIVNNAGELYFFGNSTAGNAAVTTNSGTTIFMESSSGGSARFITNSGGTFLVANLSSSGMTTGSIEGAGSYVLGGKQLTTGSNNQSTTVSGIISGSGGSLVKVGSGTLTLTGANTYSGGTTVSAGTLQGTTTSLQGAIANNASVVFDQATSGTYTGVMSGTGGLTVQGGGAVTFSGTNTYSGLTTINSGAFNVSGSIASSVTVNNGGTLSGSGTIGGNVTNSGTLAPGNVGTTLTVSGNLVHNSGATYQVAVNAAGQNSRVNAGGTATLNGGTVQVAAVSGSYSPSTTYTIVNATGGLSGTFTNVSSNFAFLTPALTYDANNAYLTLTTNFANNSQSSTQSTIGNLLNMIGPYAAGDMLTVLGALATVSPAQAEYAIRSISGQNLSGFSTTMVQTAQMFMNNLASQAGSASGGNRVMMAEACDVACDTTNPAQWGAWGGAVGGLGTIGAGQSVGAVTYNAGGFAAGLDRRFGPSFLAGVTVGYTAGTQWVGGFDGKGTSDTFQVGLYGSFTQDRFYLDGLAGYGYAYNQSWRNIVIPGLQPRTAMGQAGANQFFGQLETGYRVDIGGGPTQAYVTPFARLQGYTATQNAYTETGAQSLNLSVASVTTNSLRSVLGAVVGANMNVGWRSPIAGQLRLGWSHEYGNVDRPVTSSLVGV